MINPELEDDILRALQACRYELITLLPRVTPMYRTSMQGAVNLAKEVIEKIEAANKENE